MKICIATDCFPPFIGGVENHSYYLAKELARQGHEVTVLTHKLPPVKLNSSDKKNNDTFRVEQAEGTILHFAGHHIAADIRILYKISKFIQEKKFDIVHGQSEGSLISLGAIWLAKRKNIPTVLTKHSLNALRPTLIRILTNKILPSVLNAWADGVIGVSRAAVDDIYGLKNEIRIIGNGVDAQFFKTDLDARNTLRMQLGYKKTDIIGGYIGRLNKKKGVGILIDVISKVIKKTSDFKFVFIGSGPMENNVKSFAIAHPDSIQYLGPKPHYSIHEYYNILDIFTLASYGESFGISIIEAMVCGIPVVTLTQSAVLEIINNGVDGYITTDEKEFVEKIILLTKNSDLRKTIANQAKIKAQTQFTWQKIAEQTTEYYQYIINHYDHR